MGRGKPPLEDDGRTIANMDIDGMPWHDRGQKREGEEPSEETPPKRLNAPWLGGVLTAVLLAVIVFAGAFAVFMLLLNHIW